MKFKFNVLRSIYDTVDTGTNLYALSEGGVETTMAGEKYIEVTPDFKRVNLIRADSVKVVGTVIKEF